MCGRGSRRLGVFRRRSLTWRVSFFGLSRAVQRRTRHAAHADPQVGGMGRNRSLGASNGVEPIVTHAQARSALAPLPLRSRSAPAPQSHAPPTRTGARSRRGAGRGLSSGVPGDLRPSTPPDGAKRPSARGPSSTPIPRMTCTILLHPPPSWFRRGRRARRRSTRRAPLVAGRVAERHDPIVVIYAVSAAARSAVPARRWGSRAASLLGSPKGLYGAADGLSSSSRAARCCETSVHHGR